MGLLTWLKGDDKPRSKAPNSGAHGESRWGNSDDLDRIDAFKKDIGLPVGFLNDRQFYHPARRKPHGLVLGNTGVGKTTRVFAPLALSDAASKMSIIAVDTAGDYSGIVLPYRSTLGPSWVLDPLNMLEGIPVGSTKRARYNPMADYLKLGDRRRFPSRAERLTGMCIPTNGDRDRFFYKLSKRAVQPAIMALASNSPQNANLPSVAKLFNDDFLEWVRWFLQEPRINPRIRDLLRPFLIPRGKEFELKSILDVLNTIASEMAWIEDEAIAESLSASDFNVERLADEVCTVTLCAPINALDEGFDRWLCMMLGCFLTQLQHTRVKTPIVFICDEMAQYASETVSKLLARIYATGRKYNLRIYVAATSIGQLEKDCFQHGRHQDVLGNSGVIHVLNVSDPESSRFVKEFGGEKKVQSISRTRSSQTSITGPSTSSSSTTVSEHGVPVIRQEEVRTIDDDSQAVLLDQCPYLLYAQTKIYLDVPELKARAGKNPFFKDKPESPAKPRKPKRNKVDEVAILTKVWR